MKWPFLNIGSRSGPQTLEMIFLVIGRSFETADGGSWSRLPKGLSVGESFSNHIFEHELRGQLMPPVNFRFLFLLSLGPLLLIEQPIVKFLVDHCYFIVHFNHYSRRITSIQQTNTKQYKYVQITISPKREWSRWLPWKRLGSNLRYRLGSWLLWNFRLWEAIHRSWDHHFLSVGTLLLTIGCRGRGLELPCPWPSSIFGYLCLFVLILL